MSSSVPSSFLLLTIDDCKLISSTGDPPDQQGTLSVVCVTLEIPSNVISSKPSDADQANRDVWLVLRVGSNFEFPLSPDQNILHSKSKGSFTFQNAAGEKPRSLVLILPKAAGGHLAEDTETLEVLLAQYGILQEIDRDEFGTDGDLKGRLVLVDENDGEYVGWLGGDLQVDEEPSVAAGGKDPVVVELSDDGQQLNVHSIRPDEEDLLLRSAAFLSRGIIYAGNAIAGGFSRASTAYISSATPNDKPLEFSETTRRNVKRIHTFSGQAATVSSRTVSHIHGMIENLASRLAGSEKPPKPGQTEREKPRLLNRLLMSTDMILSAVEQSAKTVLASGSKSVAAGVGHKYGPHAEEAVSSVGGTLQHVQLVYIDARGVGRRALLKSFGKKFVKAKLGKNREVVIGGKEPQGSTLTMDYPAGAKPTLPPRSPVGGSKPPLPPREK